MDVIVSLKRRPQTSSHFRLRRLAGRRATAEPTTSAHTTLTEAHTYSGAGLSHLEAVERAIIALQVVASALRGTD